MTPATFLRRSCLFAWIFLAACTPVTENQQPSITESPSSQIVRIRLLEMQSSARISCPIGCFVHAAGQSRREELHAATVTLAPVGWRLGDDLLPPGALSIQPGAGSILSLNGRPYRGDLRLIPVAPGQFDVVNDVDIEDYLKGVLPDELYARWQPQTYEAQAIVARTYALYVAHVDGVNRYWDLYADQRSQMYGGLAAETAKSRDAVDDTRGMVLTYGPGDGKLFEAYFSSCCGGITQTAALVFPGSPNIPPLAAQNTHGLCSASPNFNWPPVTVSKIELARRIRLWGLRQTPVRPEAGLTAILRVDLTGLNAMGRPAQFTVTDDLGRRYVMNAEEFRAAVDTDAAPGTTLKSSFCKVDGNPDRSDVLFYDGHGSGHGVGMCQWCAEARAEMGYSSRGILAAAFPGAKIVRAY